MSGSGAAQWCRLDTPPSAPPPQDRTDPRSPVSHTQPRPAANRQQKKVASAHRLYKCRVCSVPPAEVSVGGLCPQRRPWRGKRPPLDDRGTGGRGTGSRSGGAAMERDALVGRVDVQVLAAGEQAGAAHVDLSGRGPPVSRCPNHTATLCSPASMVRRPSCAARTVVTAG